MANAVVTVLEADGTTETDITILDVGRQGAAASKSVALATEDKAVLDTVAALSKAEDAAHSSGDTGVQMLAVRKDTSSTGIGANGDYTPLAVDANGKLYTMTTLDASSQNANGRAAAASSSPVVLSTEDLAAVDAITAKLASYSASATFTPAASSHTAGDVNGGAQEFTSMGPSAGRIMINSATLEIDGGTAEATAWRLALFNVTPPSAVADDGAFTLPSGDRASFLGFIELGTAIDEVDTQWIEVHGINKQVKLSGTSIFAYLINRTTLTPANVAHIVTLHATVL